MYSCHSVGNKFYFIEYDAICPCLGAYSAMGLIDVEE
jgi:hypothetical protein